MRLRLGQGFVLFFVATGATALFLAVDHVRGQNQTQFQQPVRDQDIYGSQLMLARERDEYRILMRAAKTEQQRERLRAEHREQMQVRAKELGMNLADQPSANSGAGTVSDKIMGSGGV